VAGSLAEKTRARCGGARSPAASEPPTARQAGCFLARPTFPNALIKQANCLFKQRLLTRFVAIRQNLIDSRYINLYGNSELNLFDNSIEGCAGFSPVVTRALSARKSRGQLQ
jgi:hypothetical protein